MGNACLSAVTVGWWGISFPRMSRVRMTNTEALGEFRCFMFHFQHFLFRNQMKEDVGENAEQLPKNIVQDGVVVVTAVIDNLHTILDLNGDALYLQLDHSN